MTANLAGRLLPPSSPGGVRVARLEPGDRLAGVEYQLTAEVNPPADTPALDALQRHGVAALLDEHLDLLAEIEGPDGVEIEPVDHRIEVHSNGASIIWVLDAPALAFAEDAARQVLTELLERTELLTDWSVRRCEVTASDEELAALAGGSDEADVEIEIDLDDLAVVADLGETDDTDDERRARLVDAAAELEAFGPEDFGHDESAEEPEIGVEAAELVAGALMASLEVLTEELFSDVQTLEESGTPASEQEVLWVLHDLPTAYAEHYTALFAKKFLVTMAILGYRLAQPEWFGPRCVAEALAIRLLKNAARNQLELAGVLEEVPLDAMFEVFDERAFTGLDVASFVEDAEDDLDEDELAELVLVEWFEPLEQADAEDEDAEASVDETV
jgi:hypothetical protein